MSLVLVSRDMAVLFVLSIQTPSPRASVVSCFERVRAWPRTAINMDKAMLRVMLSTVMVGGAAAFAPPMCSGRSGSGGLSARCRSDQKVRGTTRIGTAESGAMPMLIRSLQSSHRAAQGLRMSKSQFDRSPPGGYAGGDAGGDVWGDAIDATDQKGRSSTRGMTVAQLQVRLTSDGRPCCVV